MVNTYLSALLDYALEKNLIQKEDSTYAINRVLHLIGADSFEKTAYSGMNTVEDILNGLLDYASEHGRLENNTVTYRDILSADIMDCFTPMPSQIIRQFNELTRQDPQKATDYFYELSRNNNYIMTERVKKDIRWETETPYGKIIITINLSKPEKDPRDIAAAREVKQIGYPKCLLCVENVGYEGHANHPARANHRIIPVSLCGENWYLQYSPYVYYNEHCIVLNEQHTQMKINRSSFEKLIAFVKQFPHYFVGSNADLPIVGGSILTHDHFQGGSAVFPMAVTNARKTVRLTAFDATEAEILNWPLSTIRLKSTDEKQLIDLAEKILTVWRAYSDPENEILAYTDALHNTITPIARQRNGKLELDLILRNNRTTSEHPLGIFHPHTEYHHIKKENIGLIEAMGIAVLPARLIRELNIADAQVKAEIGVIFSKILENCGVFKDSESGRAGFDRFMDAVNTASN